MERVLFALLAFAFSSHFFPIMAWHTVDGLFLLSVGLVLCLRESQGSKLVGYGLIGMAYLCKQNFLPMVPISIVALGDWRRIRFWLATAMPGAIYFGYLFLYEAIPDVIIQMGSQTGIFSVGVMTYKRTSVPLGILLGYLAMRLAFGQISVRASVKTTNVQVLLGTLMLYGAPLGAAIALCRGAYCAYSRASFGIFGAVMGATMYFIMEVRERTEHVRTGILVLLTAWCVSISTGYNNPRLACGPLAVFLLACSRVSGDLVDKRRWVKKFPIFLTIGVATLTMFCWRITREKYIYRERPAHDLTYSIDGLIPGAKLIRTNSNTYEFLVDLRLAIDRTGGRDYTIIPGSGCYWVKSIQENPLSIDCVQGIELSNQALFDRVVADLDAYRCKMIVLVEKVDTAELDKGFIPLPNISFYAVAQYVRKNFTKIDETRFFGLYIHSDRPIFNFLSITKIKQKRLSGDNGCIEEH